MGPNRQISLQGKTEPTSHRGQGSTLIPFVMIRPNHVDVVRFKPKGNLKALKYVYSVGKSLDLYSVWTFLPYTMWNVTNTPPIQTQHPTKPNRINSTPRSGIGFDTICNDSIQSRRYCSLRGFKTHLLD